MEDDEFQDVTDGDVSLVHRRLVGAGGYANVHEVMDLQTVPDISFTTFPAERSALVIL